MLPLSLWMMVFMVDMGRYLLTAAVVQDSAAVAARVGAQTGTPGTSSSGVSRTAFTQAVDVAPGLDPADASFRVESPPLCTDTSRYVVVRGAYPLEPLTPGLAQFLQIANGDRALEARGAAVARCEVARSP